jgi:hypothetical protein
MLSLRNIRLGVRTQAMGVIVLMVLWYSSWGYLLQQGRQTGSAVSPAELAFFFLFPTAFFLTAVLWWSYFHSGRAHRWWVIAATCLFLSPLVLLAAVYLISAS